jgi:hypothetical protein
VNVTVVRASAPAQLTSGPVQLNPDGSDVTVPVPVPNTFAIQVTVAVLDDDAAIASNDASTPSGVAMKSTPLGSANVTAP